VKVFTAKGFVLTARILLPRGLQQNIREGPRKKNRGEEKRPTAIHFSSETGILLKPYPAKRKQEALRRVQMRAKTKSANLTPAGRRKRISWQNPLPPNSKKKKREGVLHHQASGVIGKRTPKTLPAPHCRKQDDLGPQKGGKRKRPCPTSSKGGQCDS